MGYIAAGLKFERIEDQIHIMIVDAVPLPRDKVLLAGTSTITWHKPVRFFTFSIPNVLNCRTALVFTFIEKDNEI